MSKAVNLGTLADDISVSNGSVSLATSEIILPKHSTDPSNPVEGQIYYNTTDGVVRHWAGTKWLQMSNKFSATGGIETTYVLNNVSYKSHTFLTSETFSVIEGERNLEIMIVAGGGGGSQDTAGGGGAGGVYIVNSVAGIGNYTISIGGGGAKAYNSQGYNGQNSSAFGFIAIGGGGGAGSAASSAAGSGGSHRAWRHRLHAGGGTERGWTDTAGGSARLRASRLCPRLRRGRTAPAYSRDSTKPPSRGSTGPHGHDDACPGADVQGHPCGERSPHRWFCQ